MLEVRDLKDIPIGHFCGEYGDTVSNYDYPKWCVFVKHREDVVTEIKDRSGKQGISCCASGEFVYYGASLKDIPEGAWTN